MDKDLEKIIARVERKECIGTRQFFVSHNEDHTYQGVLVNNRTLCFHISPIVQYRYDLNAPLAYNAKFLFYILDFDVSYWGDVAEQDLVEKYKEVSEKFDAECDKIRVDTWVEINYSKKLRVVHTKHESEKKHGYICKDSSECPLSYHPFGFETYTSSYTRENQIPPEVISVKLINDR